MRKRQRAHITDDTALIRTQTLQCRRGHRRTAILHVCAKSKQLQGLQNVLLRCALQLHVTAPRQLLRPQHCRQNRMHALASTLKRPDCELARSSTRATQSLTQAQPHLLNAGQINELAIHEQAGLCKRPADCVRERWSRASHLEHGQQLLHLLDFLSARHLGRPRPEPVLAKHECDCELSEAAEERVCHRSCSRAGR